MTNKAKTFEAMRQYIDEQTGKIDEEYLNRNLQIALDNTEPLYNDMHNARRALRAVVWAALEWDANARLSFEFDEGEPVTVKSDHLKAWLTEYGRGYDTIAETVEWAKEERARLAAEKEGN